MFGVPFSGYASSYPRGACQPELSSEWVCVVVVVVWSFVVLLWLCARIELVAPSESAHVNAKPAKLALRKIIVNLLANNAERYLQINVICIQLLRLSIIVETLTTPLQLNEK
jgi:hypothetical protein